MLPLLETLGWWGIDFHLPAGVLLLAVGLCLIRVRQPARRRAIGGAAAIGLLLLSLLTVLPGWPRLAWRQAPPRETLPQIAEPSPSASAPHRAAPAELSALPEPNDHAMLPAPRQAPPAMGVDHTPQSAVFKNSPGQKAATPTAAIHINWPSLAGLIVIMGASWAGLWLLLGTVQAARIRRGAQAAADRGGRVAYAEVLLAWARTSPAVLPRGLDGSLALWERPSQLKRRVLTLLDRGFHVELRCSRRQRLAITTVTLTIAGLLSIPTVRPAISADDENAALDATASDTGAEPAARKTSEADSAKTPNNSSDETGAAPSDAKQPPPAGVNIAVTRGRVLTPHGKPLAGAKLFLTYSNVENVQPQVLGESGADGQFEFRVDKSQLNTSFTPDPWSTAIITAVANGFGFEWVKVSQTDADGNRRTGTLRANRAS